MHRWSEAFSKVAVPDRAAGVEVEAGGRSAVSMGPRGLARLVKRAVDVIGALLGLAVLGPVMAVLAVVVRLDGGPVLFRQERLGLAGQRFTLLKFRSMRPDAEAILHGDETLLEAYIANGYKLPPDGDPRVSRVGTFLRRTSLDELPQLWNVLVGHMSLVGPRPVVPLEIEEYGDRAAYLLTVKPGLTGLWQISGRGRVGYPERVDLELEYVQGWSLLLDLKILVLTVPRMFRGAR